MVSNSNLASVFVPVVGLIVVFMIFFVILMIAVYIYISLALMKIAQKTKTPNSWLAWVPGANIYLIIKIAGLPGWYAFGILLGLIPFIGWLIVLAGSIYVWWKIAERLNRPGWWAFLLLIPIVNFVILGIMAWGKSKFSFYTIRFNIS